MNNILLGILVIAGIMIAAAYASTSIGDVSHASTQSNQIDIEKKSESMHVLFDGEKINVKNTGKYDSEIAMFRFYDESGTEVHRTIIPDTDGRVFGETIQIVKDTTLTSNNARLQSHIPKSYSLEDIGINYIEGLTGEIVTKRGRTFPIILENNSPYENSKNGTSILDGLGVYMAIQNINTNGKVYFGDSQTGTQTDIRQYVEIGTNDDWVIAIKDNDNSETLYVPEFGKEYIYSNNALTMVHNIIPNILGYSTSRVLTGSVTHALNNDGITLSGTGEIVLALNDYTSQSLYLRGTGTGELKIVTSTYDLINDSYVTNKGFLTHTANIDPQSNSFSVIAGIDSVHTGVLSYTGHASSTTGGCGWASESNFPGTTGVPLGARVCFYTALVEMTTTLVKTNNADHHIITGDSTTPSVIYLGKYYWGGLVAYDEYNENFNFKLYDTLPSTQKGGWDADFEQVLAFPSEQTYLYAKLNGETFTIKGEAFNPNTEPFFQVTGLPVDTAFDVSKSGITGVVGKTDNSGEISLLLDDINFGVSTSPSGILKIYPNSTKYLGNFGIQMIDLLHGETVSLPIGDDLAYIPQNYVRWVFPVPVEAENVRVDGTLLNYLNKNYTKNEALMIPVIPSANTIYTTINGTDVEILMRDVATTTQIKQVPQKTSTTSDHTNDGTAYTTSNISTSTFLTATHTGTMNVNFDFKVAGSVDFTMDSAYTGGFTVSNSCKWHGASSPYRTYSCTTHRTPNNPASISNMLSLTADQQTQLTAALNRGQASNLTVEVDVLRNMQDVETILIHTSTSAQAFVTSTFSEAQYGTSNQIRMEYPRTLISDQIAIPVTAGDMMEFMVRVNLDASGAPTLSMVDTIQSSYVEATTEFKGGIITVGMS